MLIHEKRSEWRDERQFVVVTKLLTHRLRCSQKRCSLVEILRECNNRSSSIDSVRRDRSQVDSPSFTTDEKLLHFVAEVVSVLD